jgi:hypothetical protein
MVTYSDGSTASISYLASASTSLPKERWEMHAEGNSALCDNFRTTILPGGKKHRGVNQDKGQERALRDTISALVSGKRSPIGLDSIVSTSRVTQGILDSIRIGRPIDVAS